jgi:TonB family protein
VRSEAFFSGAWRDRLEILLPRLPGDPDLVGAHAVLFLEKHGGELWVAGGHQGLLVSREPFAAAAIDRLRVALALTDPPAGGEEEDAVVVDPQAGVTMPVSLRRTRPTFPDAAREAGLCGRVLLSGIVGTNGRISSLRVLKAPHPGWGFEATAVRSVSEWEYEPSTKDGQPVAVFLTVSVDFTLAGVCSQPGSGQPVPVGPLALGPRAVEDALADLTRVSLDLAGPRR